VKEAQCVKLIFKRKLNGSYIIKSSHGSVESCSTLTRPRIIPAIISSVVICLGGSVGWDSVHRLGRSVRGAGVQFPGSAGRFCVRISGAHAVRLISRAGTQCINVEIMQNYVKMQIRLLNDAKISTTNNHITSQVLTTHTACTVYSLAITLWYSLSL